MAISENDVKKIAHLARLSVDEQSLSASSKNINNILELVEQMNQVDTREVQPMSHPFDATQRLREDAVTEPDLNAELMAIAPESESGLYLVPKVIE